MSDERRKAPAWAWWVATGLGSGLLRPAPGTWGSLAGLAAWGLFSLGLGRLGQDAPGLRGLLEAGFLAAIGLMTWISVRASDRVVAQTGSHDPGFIVADEWVGMWITLWPLRWETHRLLVEGEWRGIVVLGVPFLVFRVLDIWKPWPVDQVQVLPDGQGIVADDLVAGLYGLPLVALAAPWLLAWAAR